MLCDLILLVTLLVSQSSQSYWCLICMSLAFSVPHHSLNGIMLLPRVVVVPPCDSNFCYDGQCLVLVGGAVWPKLGWWWLCPPSCHPVVEPAAMEHNEDPGDWDKITKGATSRSALALLHPVGLGGSPWLPCTWRQLLADLDKPATAVGGSLVAMNLAQLLADHARTVHRLDHAHACHGTAWHPGVSTHVAYLLCFLHPLTHPLCGAVCLADARNACQCQLLVGVHVQPYPSFIFFVPAFTCSRQASKLTHTFPSSPG